MKIKLSTVEDVREFNKIACKICGNVDLQGARYIVDAKSILGVFSLDLSQNLTLITPTKENEEMFKQWEVK